MSNRRMNYDRRTPSTPFFGSDSWQPSARDLDPLFDPKPHAHACQHTWATIKPLDRPLYLYCVSCETRSPLERILREWDAMKGATGA